MKDSLGRVICVGKSCGTENLMPIALHPALLTVSDHLNEFNFFRVRVETRLRNNEGRPETQ